MGLIKEIEITKRYNVIVKATNRTEDGDENYLTYSIRDPFFELYIKNDKGARIELIPLNSILNVKILEEPVYEEPSFRPITPDRERACKDFIDSCKDMVNRKFGVNNTINIESEE